MHTEIIGFTAFTPGASGSAAAPISGDVLTIKNNRGISGPSIIDWWGYHSGAGFQQVAFPTGHDTTRGYRAGVIPDNTYSLLPQGLSMPVTAQELLSVTIASAAAAAEQGCMLINYPDLPGVDQRVLSWSQLGTRVEKLTTVLMPITTGTSSWTIGQLAISAGGSDLLLANRDYAVLGVNTTVDVTAVAIVGPDTGYARIGAPGANQNSDQSAQYFAQLSRAQDMPLIPVINSGNKTSTMIQCLAQGVVTTTVTLFLALLKKHQ